MTLSAFARRGVSLCAAAALLAGCGGSLPQSPALPQSAADDRPAKSAGLLYVSDTVSNEVYVYSYPKGKLVQTLSGFYEPAGECVDDAGNVYIANTGGSNVLEYAHGGTTPIAALKDNGYFPVGCSVDPTTGDIAVTNFSTNSSTRGDLVIYKAGKGRPKARYTNAKLFQMLLCGYDDKGNLFVDGLTQGSSFAFAELAKGGSALTNVTLDQSIGSAGGVEWDGKYVAVGDQSTNTIYQFAIGGKKGKKTGSTVLGGATEVFQFWIAGGKVIGPDAAVGDVGIWAYPAGGSPLKTIGGLYAPLGAAVSFAAGLRPRS